MVILDKLLDKSIKSDKNHAKMQQITFTNLRNVSLKVIKITCKFDKILAEIVEITSKTYQNHIEIDQIRSKKKKCQNHCKNYQKIVKNRQST